MDSSIKQIINTCPKRSHRVAYRVAAKFVDINSSAGELSTQRIGQELITNLGPKTIFARGFVDLCDNAFREILENIIVYICPKVLGEHIFRKPYSKFVDKNLQSEVSTKASDLLKHPDYAKNKKLMPIKAALAVTAFAVPIAEYSLSYFKNLFTLKLFKQADFNNIANLNKKKIEDPEKQKRVNESAKKHIKIAGGVFAGCLGASALLLTKGKDSKILNHFSEAILAPGSKFFKNDEKKAAFFNKYFGLDFERSKTGKLAMSNGQLTACVTAGFFGYTGAAKDRGKQDFKEIMYRFPLVGFYAIAGNDLFMKGFKSILNKTDKCKEVLAEQKRLDRLPTLDDLKALAKKLATEKGAKSEAEMFKKLLKQETALVGIPTLFGFTVMGMFVAGCSRAFTKYRYDHDKDTQKI